MPSIIETHNRVKEVDWSPSYVEAENRYPTRYKIPRKTKDPFRTLVREYLTMEQEKDDRQYGGFEDVMSRAGLVKQADPGWLEAMKLALPIVIFGEYAAGKCQSMLVDTVENAELRQGYMAQALDEQRHVNQEMYLLRHFAKHAPDPAGFDRGMQARGSNLFFRAGRACFENFFVNDPIESAITLQVVAETAYTNPLFVALTEVAAINGDHATPGVFLSVQSDEARHMANGYSTLAAILSEPENLPIVQEDFDRSFWRTHTFLDPLLGVLYDYFGSAKTSSGYAAKWNEWIVDDWVGNYIANLEPFGLQIPKYFKEAADRLMWLPHTAAMVAAASWPLHYWRFPPLSDADMEWMENTYPGWYALYGEFWQAYRLLGDPANEMIPFQALPARPPLCRVCSMPCVFPTVDTSTARLGSYAGKTHAFCSAPCEEIFTQQPLRYIGYQQWDEQFHGVGLDEFIIKNNLLRADGKTLVAQPHVSDEKMWTIDDVRKLDFEILDPLHGVQAPPVGSTLTSGEATV
jgi:YHS domain-containing protein